MSETKHTPGPWNFYKGKLRPEFPTIIREILSDKGPVVTWSGFDGVDLRKTEIDANGRLIAAAPELLDACKTGFATLWAMKARLIAPRNETEQAAVHLLEQRLGVLKAAIAKAEGRNV